MKIDLDTDFSILLRHGVGGDNIRPKRTTRNYTLLDGRKHVYHGVSDNVSRRLAEHKRSGKKFTGCIVSRPKTRASALKHEATAISRYKQSHGRRPKYNKRG